MRWKTKRIKLAQLATNQRKLEKAN